jgi:hypothetical protein
VSLHRLEELFFSDSFPEREHGVQRQDLNT